MDLDDSFFWFLVPVYEAQHTEYVEFNIQLERRGPLLLMTYLQNAVSLLVERYQVPALLEAI